MLDYSGRTTTSLQPVACIGHDLTLLPEKTRNGAKENQKRANIVLLLDGPTRYGTRTERYENSYHV